MSLSANFLGSYLRGAILEEVFVRICVSELKRARETIEFLLEISLNLTRNH